MTHPIHHGRRLVGGMLMLLVAGPAQELARTLPDPGIKPGEQEPDFTLSNA